MIFEFGDACGRGRGSGFAQIIGFSSGVDCLNARDLGVMIFREPDHIAISE